MRYFILILFVAVSWTACAGSGGYTVRAAVASPDLVYVRPGVYAVANADAPVFYADDYYWLYTDGAWYRSNYVTGGWQYAPPPYVITQIRRPLAYHRHQSYRPERQVRIDVRDRPRPDARVIERDRDRDRPRPDARVIERDHRERQPAHDRD